MTSRYGSPSTRTRRILPDSILGVSRKKQARYLRLAYGIALANPKIEMLIWFLIKDERRPGANLAQGWQSGLMTAGGKKKSRV